MRWSAPCLGHFTWPPTRQLPHSTASGSGSPRGAAGRGWGGGALENRAAKKPGENTQNCNKYPIKKHSQKPARNADAKKKTEILLHCAIQKIPYPPKNVSEGEEICKKKTYFHGHGRFQKRQLGICQGLKEGRGRQRCWTDTPPPIAAKEMSMLRKKRG